MVMGQKGWGSFFFCSMYPQGQEKNNGHGFWCVGMVLEHHNGSKNGHFWHFRGLVNEEKKFQHHDDGPKTGFFFIELFQTTLGLVYVLLLYLPGHWWWSLELLREHHNPRIGMSGSGVFEHFRVVLDDVWVSV